MLEARMLLSGTSYAVDLIVTTGSSISGTGTIQTIGETSINDAGRTAFLVSMNMANGSCVLAESSTGSVNVITFPPGGGFRPYKWPQINNANDVVATDGGPPLMCVRTWNADAAADYNTLADTFDAYLGTEGFTGLTLPTLANDGGVFFIGTWTDNRTGLFYNPNKMRGDNYLVTWLTGGGYRPAAADGGQVVLNATGNDITLYQGGLPITIASPSGYPALGRAPGISGEGDVIAFYGTDSDGAGVFVSIANGAARTLFRVAGISGNGVLNPGEVHNDVNGNGIVDPGEDVGGFTSFVSGFDRCGVDGSGSQFWVVYQATDESGNTGIYTTAIDITNPTSPGIGNPRAVAIAGESIPGLSSTPTGFYLYDPINSSGQVVFRADLSGGGSAVVRATPEATKQPGHDYFEDLAKGAAYWNLSAYQPQKPGEKGQPLPYENNPFDFVVDKVFDDASTGFYAVGLVSERCDPILLLRGTEMLSGRDWMGNMSTDGVGYWQFENNWNDLEEWLLHDPDVAGTRLDIIGHSLGGALAQWVAAELTSYGRQIGEVVTFNAAGIAKARSGLLTDAGEFRYKLTQGVTHYIVNGDPVSMVGEQFIEGSFITVSFSDPTWIDFDKHLRPILTGQLTNENGSPGKTRPSDVTPPCPAQPVALLNAPSFGHNDPDMRKWLVGAAAVLGLLRVPPPLSLVPFALMRRDTAEAARQFIGLAFDRVKTVAETAAFQWVVEAGKATLQIAAERGHDFWELIRPGFDQDVQFTVDSSDPPAFVFTSAMNLTLGDDISIALPSWLGGTVTADHLVKLVSGGVSGRMDVEKLAVSGQLKIFGDMLTLNGSAEVDWSQSVLDLRGSLNLLGGFITANADVQVQVSGSSIMAGGGASLNIPSTAPRWLFPGATLAGGQFLLSYTHDLSLSNDFIAGWATVLNVPLGLRVWFDGRVDPLGAEQLASLSPMNLEDQYEIDPGTDWVIFESDWDNVAPGAELVLVTPGGVTLTEEDIAADPNLTMVDDLITDRRRAVAVTGPETGVWTVRLENAAPAGEVRFMALRNVAAAAVSITGTSGGLLRTPVRIDFQAFSEDPDATVSLYCDSDDSGLNGSLIVHGLPAVDGSYDWDTSDVPPGDYYIYAVLADDVNVPATDYTADAVVVSDPASIAARYVFYNRSYFDGNNASANASDDLAIDVGKQALLPGETATFANFTSHSRGINGIMVDIQGLADPAGLMLANIDNYFTFKVGNDDNPSGWNLAPAPSEVLVRQGEGDGGSARVTLIWPDGAIQKQWLQVKVLSDVNGGHAGLAADDVFYFGNLPGNANGDGAVDAADYIALKRAFGSTVASPGGSADFDCSGTVDWADLQALTSHFGASLGTAPVTEPVTPQTTTEPGQANITKSTEPTTTTASLTTTDTVAAPEQPISPVSDTSVEPTAPLPVTDAVAEPTLLPTPVTDAVTGAEASPSPGVDAVVEPELPPLPVTDAVAEVVLPTPAADTPHADILAIAASVLGDRLAADRQVVPVAMLPTNPLPPLQKAVRVGPLPTFPSPLLSFGMACPVVADVLQLAAPWWSGCSAKHEAPDEPWMTSLATDIAAKPRKDRLDPIGLDVL